MTRSIPRAAVLAAALATATLFSACAPLLVGGAMIGGSFVAVDRRTSGAQLEDQAIELKSVSRINDLATLGNISVTSYNRFVLITGEVPAEADRNRVEQVVRRIENVRGVDNELAVGPNATLGDRSSDSIISAKVKASFIDAKDLQANAIKVVCERGVVYLLGIVTEREAKRASDIARGVSGVQKVVRVFEIISEQELAGLQPKQAPVETKKP
ncbi:MAG: BON domain-containing protein [Burkholderiales bacterium]|nr:BON domain-containing protein [Burkholderiales bacterium]MDE2396102.1 BON domain-containing protein [Burkholderiales bacterium]MDE2457168.1 BON domain-containing protein [Burkholderiales bacterium]